LQPASVRLKTQQHNVQLAPAPVRLKTQQHNVQRCNLC
jgi:hypothetical protein